MRTTFLSLMTATALISGAAFAQMETPAADNGVPVLSGGVGSSDRAMIEAQQANYRLKLVFSGQGGAYLSDVNVTLADKSGGTVVSTVTDGPILLLSPPAGTYKVTAVASGIEKTLSVTAGASGLKTYQINFPIRDDAELTDGNGVYLPKASGDGMYDHSAPAPAGAY
jgi:hypothetical protein